MGKAKRRISSRIDVRIDCSPDEARRLLGQPALLPLYETMALARERWLMAVVARSVEATRPGGDERDGTELGGPTEEKRQTGSA